ncbi:hypothetical protein MGN70_003271 [Eutypa lata]|nr:hypothetical protein MGN70_003271 [Eutypa lata]
MPVLHSRDAVNASNATNASNELAVHTTGGIIAAAVVFGSLLVLSFGFWVCNRFYHRRREGGRRNERSGNEQINGPDTSRGRPGVDMTTQGVELQQIAAPSPTNPSSGLAQNPCPSVDIGDSQQTYASRQTNSYGSRNWPLRPSVEEAIASGALPITSTLPSETAQASQGNHVQAPQLKKAKSDDSFEQVDLD